MAATSTSWGLGAHKMTADISSPTPVTSPSADSPLRAHSYSSVVEGPSKETQPQTSSSSVNGKSDGATAAAAAVAAVAAAKLAVSSNGIGRAPSSIKDVGPKEAAAVEDDGSEAAGTSSDSGGDDDEEEERAESSKPPERTENQGRGAKEEVVKGKVEEDAKGRLQEEEAKGRVEGEAKGKVEQEAKGKVVEEEAEKKSLQANRHHGPSEAKRKASETGGNGHAIKAAAASPPAARQEVDEHAARASDAATAALAAALASATRLPTSPRPPRPSTTASSSPSSSSSRATAGATLQSAKSEGHGGSAATAAGGGRAARIPIVMTFRLPRGRDLSEEVEPPDVDRALAAARFVPNRSPSPHGKGTRNGGSGGGGYDDYDEDGLGGADGEEEESEPLPLPLPLPTQAMPCMVGNFKVDHTTGVHRCAGTWAMNKSDLQAAARIETRASPFEFKTAGGGGNGSGGPARFPYTGRYQGHFFVRQPPKPVTKVEENELHLAFAKNSAGGWNVEGSGRNIYGPFSITGRLGADRRLEVYRAYAKVPSSKSHRRGSSSSHHASPAPPRRAPPSTPVGRMPNRGKHPQSAPPAVYAPPALAAAALPSAGYSNGSGGGGGLAAMAEDASLESPAPAGAGRRVSRTPSYLIKDIGNDGTAHLSHGLRRCVTVLRSLTVVRGKSEWFLDPVDYVALKLTDYPLIIKRPMDLGTVRKRLEGGMYQKTTEFASDVRLVFSNARLYNADPTSLVHTAARELYEMFEAKLAALGPNLDDPPLKRKKSAAALLSGGSSGGAGDASNDYEPERERKRKNGGGSKSNGDGSSGGSGGGGGSASKKQRATSSAPARPAPTPKPVAAPPPPPVVAPPSPVEEDDFSGADMNMPPSMLMMQRKIAEMEAQIQRMQGQVVAQPATETPQRQSGASGGTKRKSKAGGAKGEGKGSSKGGAKAAKGGASKKAGGARGGANSAAEKRGGSKAPKTPRVSKAAAAAKAAAAKAAEDARAAAAAAVPLTFDEKKALSVAINKLDQTNLTRVVEIIQARMPLGSSDEEIELDIDSMDNLTLRDLQAFIMEVSAKGGGSRKHNDIDSDSDAEPW